MGYVAKIIHPHWVKQQEEATRIYRLWHPRPTPKDDVCGNQKIAKRVERLLQYGYSFKDLRKWFRLGDYGTRHGRYGIGIARFTIEDERIFEEIKAAYKYRCAYCGKKTTNLEKDHIKPIARGGKNLMENIVPACPLCNRSKNAKQLLDWPQFYKLQLHFLGFTDQVVNGL